MTEAFSHTYFMALLAGLDDARRRLPQISTAAEAVADRVLAGGQLWLASEREDFVSEGHIRSGGLMFAREWSATMCTPGDVIIAGWPAAARDQALLLQLRDSGALILHIGPEPSRGGGSEPPTDETLLSSSVVWPAAATAPFGGETYPLVSLQNLVLLWVLTGEIVAALSRRGHMPAMFQSVLVPGARARNAQFTERFHPTHSVAAMDAGFPGGDYLDGLGAILTNLAASQGDTIDAVAQAGAQVLQSGGSIHAGMISHFPMHQHGAPGDPLHMQRLSPLDGETPSTAEIEARVQSGDLLFFLGYYRRPVAAYEVAHRAGARIVEIITGDGSMTAGEQPDYRIRPGWPFGDALTTVPGYDVEILPASGIVQTAIYWAVVGSISQALGD